MKNTLLHIKSFLVLLTLATLFGLVTANAQLSSQGGTQSIPQDNDTTRGELASFDRFMDSHPEMAEQLRRDPSLVTNEEFVEKHPALQEYLQQHPGVREEITENPNRFMRQEQRFDRREDGRDNDRRDNDTTRGELASFDRFMDSHPEIAEQLRRDPSLVKNEEFVEKHPALQEYLQQHPGVREEITENPNGFMRQEQRFDRIEDNRNHQSASGDMDNFRQFLGSHSTLAQQLSQDPRFTNSEEFQTNHPELQQFLKAHPGVQEGLKQNPQMFMKSAQQFSGNQVPKTSNVEPKPKQ